MITTQSAGFYLFHAWQGGWFSKIRSHNYNDFGGHLREIGAYKIQPTAVSVYKYQSNSYK